MKFLSSIIHINNNYLIRKRDSDSNHSFDKQQEDVVIINRRRSMRYFEDF